MPKETLFSSQGTVLSEEISSPAEMKRVINMLMTENANLKEKLDMLTDTIGPLLKQKK